MLKQCLDHGWSQRDLKGRQGKHQEVTDPQTTHQVTLCYRHNSQPCSVVISPLLTPPAWVFRVVQTSFLPGIESLRWARTFISREILDAVVIQTYSSWRKGCQERLKRDSGPSKLPARIRGRLSLPASVSILKRKARDMGCPLLPQARGRQQGASPIASPFSRCLSVL